MGTKTISLADDAYEKLRAHKREGESFSDVVRRLAGGVTLSEYHGVIEEDTADELEEILAGRRDSRSETHRERVDTLADELDG
ncbi:antitoxin VapB family protein [Natronomonas gomsonensis]|uniref:antitoxin VapB family protein n=1 Tax=Natronomonas gomsonensis TaxID=1046043 RepID=UPI0015BF3F75|nr:antitoxin VapB family protein [Natronomonas gomsonensis]